LIIRKFVGLSPRVKVSVTSLVYTPTLAAKRCLPWATVKAATSEPKPSWVFWEKSTPLFSANSLFSADIACVSEPRLWACAAPDSDGVSRRARTPSSMDNLHEIIFGHR
jgi:hypothetical protein